MASTALSSGSSRRASSPLIGLTSQSFASACLAMASSRGTSASSVATTSLPHLS